MTKISIICVTRNDEYGMYQDLRTRVFLNGLNQIKNKEIYELVLVDWNPLPDRLSFYEQYKDLFPKNLKTKFVTVPSEVHKSIVGSSVLRVFEYQGKNVGARYSSGSYLIFTNPDNFFFPELWSHVENNISDESFTRLCRCDVRNPNSGYVNVDYIDGKDLMESPIHFYYTPGHDFKTPNEYLSLNEGFYWDISHEGASGDFLGVSRKNFELVNGFGEDYTYGGFDGIIMRDLFKKGIKQFILPTISIHIDHTRVRVTGSTPTNIDGEFNNKESWGLLGEDRISVIEI
jgi:hypothetical protein